MNVLISYRFYCEERALAGYGDAYFELKRLDQEHLEACRDSLAEQAANKLGVALIPITILNVIKLKG